LLAVAGDSVVAFEFPDPVAAHLRELLRCLGLSRGEQRFLLSEQLGLDRVVEPGGGVRQGVDVFGADLPGFECVGERRRVIQRLGAPLPAPPLGGGHPADRTVEIAHRGRRRP
jgi:hypothetical protein